MRTPVPRNNQVILKPLKNDEQVTKGGIILPNTAGPANNLAWGEVVAVGPGGITSDGARIAIDLKPGDVVACIKGLGDLFAVEGEQFACVPDEAVAVRLEREEERQGRRMAS